MWCKTWLEWVVCFPPVVNLELLAISPGQKMNFSDNCMIRI
jgi:hypothetical protein